jgi:phytoene desaturase (3,4-didehydrolycopene-forming)
LQWTETCEGIWYPIGGFNRVPQSLVEIAESHGAKFHFSTPVNRVTYNGDKVTGVKLENGKEVKADIVVVNADLVWAYNNLFTKPQGGLVEKSAAERLEKKPHS